MPNAVSTSSPLAQQQAVGELLYHAAVALRSDFEAYGTGAYPSYIPSVLSTYFNYSSGSYESKSLASTWYSKIKSSIDDGKPVFYAMWESNWGNGHAVVCDGYRNGNEIHLNLGWSGYANAWYNIDSVNASGYSWTLHGGVFNITPAGAGVLAVSPAVLDIGSIAQSGSGQGTFTLRNTGNAMLSGTATASGQVSITSGSSYTLAPGASQTVTLSLDTSSIGTKSGSVTFTGGAGSTRSVQGTVVTDSATPTPLPTATAPGATPSATATPVCTATPTPTRTATWTPTRTATPMPTRTATWTPTRTATPVPTRTATRTPANTATPVMRKWPDLRIGNVVATPLNSSQLLVSFRVYNDDLGNAGTNVVHLHLVASSASGTTDVFLKAHVIAQIAGRDSTWRSVVVSIPTAYQRKPWSLLLEADATSKVSESNETNNTALLRGAAARSARSSTRAFPLTRPGR